MQGAASSVYNKPINADTYYLSGNLARLAASHYNAYASGVFSFYPSMPCDSLVL